MTDFTVRVCMNALELLVFAIISGIIGSIVAMAVKK